MALSKFKWLFLLFFVCKSSEILIYELYEKSRIIKYDCDMSVRLGTEYDHTLYTCALSCNHDSRCWRFLYCQDTKQCKLYEDGRDCSMSNIRDGCSCHRKVIRCHGNNCTCPWGYYGNDCKQIVIDCRDAMLKGFLRSANILTRVKPLTSPEPFDLVCWLSHSGQMTILERNSNCFDENFNRSLEEYKTGFGAVSWNRWLGFNKIGHLMNTPSSQFNLLITLNTNEKICQIRYDKFKLGDSTTQYHFEFEKHEKLSFSFCGDSLGGANGTTDLRGRPFSTYDSDGTTSNCPGRVGGGWWYADHPGCSASMLTGSPKTSVKWSNILANAYIYRMTIKLEKT